MSTATVVFFVISLGTFILLLALATVLFLRTKSSTPAPPPTGLATHDASGSAKRVFTCDAEAVILDSTVQITNLEEKPMRLEASSAGSGLELVTNDQWVQKLTDGTSVYRIFASSEDSLFDQVAMEIKVTPTEVAVKPVMKSDRSQVQIWKLKPVLFASQRHLVERQVFSGRLQKTVNFDRVVGKYYKIQVTTEGNRGSKRHGLHSTSNVADSEHHLLLTVRVEAGQVQASNLTNRRMEVAVSQASDQSSLLKRKLTDEVQDMPLNGTFAFAIQPGKSPDLKDLLCLKLTDQSLVIEPYTKFGTVPLICEVRCPPAAAGGGRSTAPSLGDAAQTVIVSGEVLSPLQLPRRAYCYVLAFYMRVSATSPVAGGGGGGTSGEQTSYTLQ